MTHPCVIRPDEHAVYAADRMGKTHHLRVAEPARRTQCLRARTGARAARARRTGQGLPGDARVGRVPARRTRTADVGRRSPGRARGDSARCPEYRERAPPGRGCAGPRASPRLRVAQWLGFNICASWRSLPPFESSDRGRRRRACPRPDPRRIPTAASRWQERRPPSRLPRRARGLLQGEDGRIRCWWAGKRSALCALSRRRMGPAGPQRPSAVREDLPRGLPVGTELADDPAQARALPRGVRRLRPRTRGAATPPRRRPGCSRTRASSAIAARSNPRSTTPGAPSTSSRSAGRSRILLGMGAAGQGAAQPLFVRRAAHRPARRRPRCALSNDLKARAAGPSSGRPRSTPSCRPWAS